ncbi:MAG TPA: ribosome silencing factor [Burkholderiaceae bacterium]|nr:ribosome silencing factor [Burkholderiaceae bacterium]
MDIRKLQRAIVDGLEDVKGQNIVVFNTEHLSSLFERVIIASGTSNRQTKSLASSVRESVKSAGFPVPRLEGEDNGEWIIVDCGAAVAHVMQPAIRDYYHLEEIWGDKPVKMKLDGASAKAAHPKPVRAETISVRGHQGERSAAKKAPAKKATPVKPGVTRVVGVKSAAGKAGAKKAPAKKAAPAKSAAAKTTTAAKKAPAKKAVAKRPAARKTATRG